MPNHPLSRSDYSVAIQALRPILIIVMTWAHMPLLHGYFHPTVTPELPASVLGTLLRDTLARGTVPLLTVISGYLAFASYSRKSYPRFVRDKVSRILLPFLLWNAIVLAYLYGLNLAFGRDIGGHIGSIHDAGDVVLSIIGYNRTPVNAPTYFLRDLFLILLFVPLIDLLTRNRLVGIGLSLTLLALMLTVLPLFLVVNGHGILYRNDMPFFFMIGFLVARHDFGLRYQSDWKALAGMAGLLAICAAASFWLAAAKPSVFDFLRYRPLFGLLMVALVPFLISLIARNHDGAVVSALVRLGRYSYIIFLSHMMVVYYLSGGFSDPLSATLQAASLSNQSPLWMQLLYVGIYTVLCVALGVAIKLAYDTVARRLARPGTDADAS